MTLVAEEGSGEPYPGDCLSITARPIPGSIILSGTSFEVKVTFSPTSEGTHQPCLRIDSNDSNGNEIIWIPLLGKGIAAPGNTKTFKLKGLEVVKGFDIGDIRYGTTFLGEVHEGSESSGFQEVIYWWTVIRHTDTENIEVCGGTNNLLKVTLEVVLDGGTLAGNRLVLGLKDPSFVEDVVWDRMAPLCGPACYDEDCACPNNPEELEEWNCTMQLPEGYGPVARIPSLDLQKKWGTTLSIDEAHFSGWLCHNWLFVPRVLGYLTVTLPD